MIPVYADKVKVTELKFKHHKQLSKVTIMLSGSLERAPELLIKKNILQVSMPKAMVWPSIKKRVSVLRPQDSELMAYQFNKEIVRIRTILPFTLKGMEERVNLTIKENSLELSFPSRRPVEKITKKVPLMIKSGAEKKKSQYDETYLNYLLEKKEETEAGIAREEVKSEELLEDKVQMIQSSVEKKNNPLIEEKSLDVMGYVGKYIAFLGLILLGLYGFVLFFKKGVLKKGKLGFLNDTDLVSVLSTTYLAPKRSLLVVKVHHKVLLLGSSEGGLTYLSELEDVSDLLKEGEKKVAGNNFDTTIHEIKGEEITGKMKLKKNPFHGQSSTKEKENMKKEKSSLSEQIRQKVKDLRPL